MNKRIIIIGPAAAGKDFLKSKFRKRGFKIDSSYTTRQIREGEIEDVTYHYISKDKFNDMIKNGDFYEFTQHGTDFYGTGQKEWDECDVFIMESNGIASINEEDRKNCFVIYLNPSIDHRMKRMKERNGWTDEKIQKRITDDDAKFDNFTDYDIMITNPYF